MPHELSGGCGRLCIGGRVRGRSHAGSLTYTAGTNTTLSLSSQHHQVCTPCQNALQKYNAAVEPLSSILLHAISAAEVTRGEDFWPSHHPRALFSCAAL